MRRFLPPKPLLAAAFSFAIALNTTAAPSRPQTTRARPLFAVPHESVVLHSSRSATSFKATSSPDSFYIYGGPGSLLGKFQTELKQKDRQGWTSHDVTDQPSLWQPSTFNSPTGTMAMWAGQTAGQQQGWMTAPGYGNAWTTYLNYRATASDPTTGQTVGLDFVFNHDSEGGYDYFDVEYDSSGVATRVFHRDGNNRDTSGVFVPTSYVAHSPAPIVYGANGYGGAGGDEIVIRMVFRSDGAWSDEDGLFPSDGAAQVDDITVTALDGSIFEDFEGPPTGFHWRPEKGPFAGDFGELFAMLSDLAPCRENPTPALGFIDDGRGPYNPSYTGTGTGGTTSVNWDYGVAGGWVLNYNGGVSAGSLDLHNQWWSPEIDWDLPDTTADDALDCVGAKLRFSVWIHFPFSNGMYYQWAVRGQESGQPWSLWENRNFLFWHSEAEWWNLTLTVSDLLPPDRERVQIQFSVLDLASLFAYPGADATPAPLFDNVAFVKFCIGGPSITTRSIDLLQDSFPQGGGTEVSTRSGRDLLDVRVDMARDINSGRRLLVPGDSLIVDVVSIIDGIGISDPLSQITMHYSLNMNPLFEAAIRENAPISDVATGLFGWDQHEGVVQASQVVSSTGATYVNRYFFDLPDADFMYPGDVLEYYIRAEDDALNMSTLPAEFPGFDDTTLSYDRTFTMRALPSYSAADGSQPSILFWNDFGRRGGEEEALLAFHQNGLYEGVHFDSYTTQGPSSMVSNGLGSAGAHGANADQLDGYSCIIYESGDLSAGLISNGSNAGYDDKGDDAGVLQAWWSKSGENRGIAHFGDNLASMLKTAGSANGYLATVINATWIGKDIRPTIGNQMMPLVRPSGAVATFGRDFITNGGCILINQFDSVAPGAGAVVGHEFMDAGRTVAVGNASIYNIVTDTAAGVHQSLFFPYGRVYVNHPTGKIGAGASARSALLEEILDLFGGEHLPAPGPAVGNPVARRLTVNPAYPNPFNPETLLSFDVGREARGSVKIYNLRGALVRSLAEGDFSAGRNLLRWRGKDDGGARVASGVYLVRYVIDGFEKSQKLVLVE
jgi:hypothetical protein